MNSRCSVVIFLDYRCLIQHADFYLLIRLLLAALKENACELSANYKC